MFRQTSLDKAVATEYLQGRGKGRNLALRRDLGFSAYSTKHLDAFNKRIIPTKLS